MHAKWEEHSLLLIHSGLQFGGELIKLGRQEQEAWSLTSLHSEFGPHGDGWHGFITTGSSSKMKFKINWVKFGCKIYIHT